MSSDTSRPKKLQRISQACDLCHRRSIRCRPSAENPQQQCQNCYDFDVECTYNRPSRRKRNQSVSHIAPPNLLPSQKLVTPDSASTESASLYIDRASVHDGRTPDYSGAGRTLHDRREEDFLGVAWRSFALASSETIERYLEIYMDIVYPIFPLFHGPSLWQRLRAQEHLIDRGFFASIMAACALASARVRDGAIEGMQHHAQDDPAKQSEIFFAAAQDAITKDLAKIDGSTCSNYLRAFALLSLASLQYGQLSLVQQYLGHYMTLAAMRQFHDESSWPSGITVFEREESRRLFWSMYMYEIFLSVTFNCPFRSQEAHYNVAYPIEANDTDLAPGMHTPPHEDSWLRGWNFTVDLYRILEHTLCRMRRNRRRRGDRIAKLFIADSIGENQLMNGVLELYYHLPAMFKEFSVAPTGDKDKDIFAFQAANIQATLQLVRITVFSCTGDLHNDFQQKCGVAQQVLETFRNISPQFLKAISTPLVYHLGAIGTILASAIEGMLTEESYARVRALLVSMADLLEGLESSLQPTAGASKDIRERVNKFDQYMHAQRHMMASLPRHDPTATQPANAQMQPPHSLPHRPGMFESLDEFQIPQDVVGEWPWPFDFTQEAHHSVAPGFQ